jgi:hypothetical protein
MKKVLKNISPDLPKDWTGKFEMTASWDGVPFFAEEPAI